MLKKNKTKTKTKNITYKIRGNVYIFQIQGETNGIIVLNISFEINIIECLERQ